jgi:phosphoribosylformylglycinamidine cyclo-ligase
MNYNDAGVNIEAGRDFVEKIKKKAPTIGGFNGMLRIPSKYKKPVLVSGADGVGTKLNLAFIANDYTTIGIDLVAMCVNDVITCGAKPLYFLDYISTKKLDGRLDDIIQGIVEGCEISKMELLGGETAEHGRFSKDIDLAGFCTGIVEEDKIIDGSKIQPGDLVVGIESSGLHSNGYSLINDMLWRHKIFYKEHPELLTPTTIYAPLIMYLLRKKRPIHGMAHITGGGIPENLPRCLPEGLKVEVDYDSWDRPEIFKTIAKAGDISEDEMRKVFNLGIGYCLIIPQDSYVDTGIKIWGHGMRSWVIGEVSSK